MAITLVYADLVAAYPNVPLAEVKTLIGGRVDADWIENACALRVSRALNYGGLPVPFIRDADKKQQTVTGADGKWYIFRVTVLANFLAKQLGAAAITAKARAAGGVDGGAFIGIKGIIGMKVSGWSNATGHFTLWTGSACIDGTNYLPEASSAWLWKAT